MNKQMSESTLYKHYLLARKYYWKTNDELASQGLSLDERQNSEKLKNAQAKIDEKFKLWLEYKGNQERVQQAISELFDF